MKTVDHVATTADRMPFAMVHRVNVLETLKTATETSTLMDVKSTRAAMNCFVGLVRPLVSPIRNASMDCVCVRMDFKTVTETS